MKTYQISEQLLNKVIEMLDDYSTLVYYDFEIKDLINKLKELKNEDLSGK